MALQAIGRPFLQWPAFLGFSSGTSLNTNFASLLLDAASEAAALVMQAPKTGNIDRVKWRTNTWTTAGADPVQIAIETVANNGLPNFTKTLFGTNTEGTKTPVATDDNVWIETTLTAAAAVTQGAAFAVCIRNPPANASNFNVAAVQSTNNPYRVASSYFPRGATALGAPPTAFATATVQYPMIAVRYDDGTWYSADGLITGTGGSTAYNSGTNPRYRGNRFQVPFKCRAIGIAAFILNAAANSNFIARIRDDAGTTLASSGTFDGDWMLGTTNDGPVTALLTTSVELSPGTWYRMTIEPQTANNIALASLDINNADVMTTAPGGTNFYMTTSNDLTTWTDTTTQKHSMALIIDALDDGVGGGGGLALPAVRAVG